MINYFYITKVNLNSNKRMIESLEGYTTDAGHTLYFPPRKVTRQEAINIVESGDILFLNDGCYRKVTVKDFLVEGKYYLRVDGFQHAMDFVSYDNLIGIILKKGVE